MIVKTIDYWDFCEAFENMGRGDQFSSEALGVIFGYLEDLSEDMAEPMELDAIAICCEWSEYNSATEAAAEYDNDFDRGELTGREADENEAAALEYLQDHTTVIGLSGGGVVIQDW